MKNKFNAGAIVQFIRSVDIGDLDAVKWRVINYRDVGFTIVYTLQSLIKGGTRKNVKEEKLMLADMVDDWIKKNEPNRDFGLNPFKDLRI